MATRVIYGEADHLVRATGLAQAYATTAHNVDDEPYEIAGLQKLVFWGHGNTSKFCGLESPDFVKLVGKWRGKNSTLHTVEMLTCNARHRQRDSDSYTEQVVNELSRRKNRKADKVKFRALPVVTTPSGKTCEWSILKWHPGSATWAYVATPDSLGESHQADSLMFKAVMTLEDFMPPRGPHVGYRLAHAAMKQTRHITTLHPISISMGWDQQAVDEFNKRLQFFKREASIMSASLGLLRWMLVDIK